ncbi:hypothetical protein RYX36_029343, partial [Vicia faba]
MSNNTKTLDSSKCPVNVQYVTKNSRFHVKLHVIIRFVEHRCKCPICDKPIDFLIPTLENKSHHNPKILSKIHAYNTMFGPISKFPFFFLYHVLFRDLLTNNVSPTILLNAGFFISIIMNLAYMLSPLREIFGINMVWLLWLFWLSDTAAVYKSELCIRHG